jgi:hypothetical protein
MQTLNKSRKGIPPYNPIDPTDYYKRNNMEHARANFDNSLRSQLSLFFEARKWNKAVSQERILDRINSARENVKKLPEWTEGGDKFAIRQLAMELTMLGSCYHFGMQTLMSQVLEAEISAGGINSDLPRLVGGPFNVQENYSGGRDDRYYLDRVIQGKKPATAVDKSLCREAKSAGLLVISESLVITVSKPVPAREFVDLGTTIDNFSNLHPLIAKTLLEVLEKMLDYPPAYCLKILQTCKLPKLTHWPVRHVIAGMLYGYPIEEVYRYVHADIFSVYHKLEPPFRYGVLEEWGGLEFKRILSK